MYLGPGDCLLNSIILSTVSFMMEFNSVCAICAGSFPRPAQVMSCCVGTSLPRRYDEGLNAPASRVHSIHYYLLWGSYQWLAVGQSVAYCPWSDWIQTPTHNNTHIDPPWTCVACIRHLLRNLKVQGNVRNLNFGIESDFFRFLRPQVQPQYVAWVCKRQAVSESVLCDGMIRTPEVYSKQEQGYCPGVILTHFPPTNGFIYHFVATKYAVVFVYIAVQQVINETNQPYAFLSQSECSEYVLWQG